MGPTGGTWVQQGAAYATGPHIIHFVRLLGLSLFFALGALRALGSGPLMLFWVGWAVVKMVPVLLLLLVFNRYEGVHGLGRATMLAAAATGYCICLSADACPT